jgi:hypothetical protein
VVILTPRLLHFRGKSPRYPRGWMGNRAALDALTLSGIEPSRSVRSLVTIPTELPRLLRRVPNTSVKLGLRWDKFVERKVQNKITSSTHVLMFSERQFVHLFSFSSSVCVCVCVCYSLENIHCIVWRAAENTVMNLRDL